MQRPYTINEVKVIMRQLLQGLQAVHSIGLMHRDLKPANILIDKEGTLKLADFGQTRVVDSSFLYTLDVGTKWYKAPELLLGNKKYTEKMDMWALGCILVELLDGCPLFAGSTDFDQIAKIGNLLGKPDPACLSETSAKLQFPDWPIKDLKEYFGGSISDDAIDLIKKLLVYNPSKRISVEEFLCHEFMQISEVEYAKTKARIGSLINDQH
ncbi:hypothetical protein FGO68_gene9610 [Halteria grandinella]|uniref:Protein kinase domain-containing protein n=1 Tax=Halteria grandinella TaxID=5974 RepID=A0A8J8SVA7_HALGN|nr:hypothetical protein FGO68_gene9610 [Halteria grandinella]